MPDGAVPAQTGQTPVKAALGAVATTTAAVIPIFLVGGLAVQISDELHFSPAGLGIAVSLYFAASALVAMPAGWLVERYGDRLTSRAGVLISATSMLCTAAFAHSYLSLVLVMVMSAGGNALGQLSSNLSLARSVPRHRQGLSFGVKQSAIPIATLLAGAAVPTIGLTVGWRWAFVVCAVAALLVIPLAPRGPRPLRVASGPGADNRVERATGPLIVLALGAAFSSGSASALGIFLVDSSVAQGIDPATAGGMLTLGSVVGAISRLGGGWWADKRGGNHIAVVAGTLLLGAGGLALLSVDGMPTLVIGTVIGYGLGWSWPGVLNFAVVRLNPLAPAAATSITQSGVYVGGCAGPLLFGLVAAHSYPDAWLAASGAMVVAALLMLLGRRLLLAHPSVQATLAAAPAR
jgi:MFS family permease